MAKKHLSKKIVIFTILILLLLLLFVFFKTFYDKATQLPATSTEQKSVTKTSLSNGYSSSSTENTTSSSSKTQEKAATSVENTGIAGWLQVKSKGTGEKFTDLSTGSFKIYKAHSPQILKTAVATNSPVMSMAAVAQKYPNSLIMNASGFNMTTGEVTGFQINNGKLFKDWDSDKRAKNAFVFNKDGSAEVYDSSTAATKILENGADMSFSFGSILIKDGKTLPSDGTVNWEIHSFLGNDKDNNIYLIISDTNTNYQTIISEFEALHLENVVVMDGGGSSQMSINGQTIYPSQDNRSVNDYIVLK